MKSLPLANKRRPPALIWQAAALIVNRESFSETLRFSSIHLFRATQRKAQFLTRTAQQGFEVLMTHGGCIADHSESLLSLWAMPFIRCDNISFYVGCKETCSITISPVHQKILYLPTDMLNILRFPKQITAATIIIGPAIMPSALTVPCRSVDFTGTSYWSSFTSH